jgi:hypothetical protein
MTADSCAVAIAGDTQVIEFVRSARGRLIFVAPAVNQAVAAAICEGDTRKAVRPTNNLFLGADDDE